MRLGTAARICRVTRKTIFNWVKQGTLKSSVTRGGHNRIWPGDLHAFLDRAGMDVDFTFDETRKLRVLLVNDKPHHNELLRKSFSDRFPSASVASTQCQYEALLLVGEQKPQVVTWDLSLPRFDRDQIVEFLTKRKMNASIHVTLCHHTDPEKLKWRAYSGAAPEERTGTGLAQMLDSLQLYLAGQSCASRHELPLSERYAFRSLILKD